MSCVPAARELLTDVMTGLDVSSSDDDLLTDDLASTGDEIDDDHFAVKSTSVDSDCFAFAHLRSQMHVLDTPCKLILVL